MVNSYSNQYPNYTNAGVNITCNVIDPTKLPPNSPLLQPQVIQEPQQPVCQQPCSYPGNYYVNNYAPNQGNYPSYPPTMYPPPANETNSGRKKRIQTITDNYIKNLEAFLEGSEQQRKDAAREITKRFDEDKSRYNDAALNALVNKMLQDSECHQVKATALTLLDTQLAQGNNNTVNLLQNMAQNDTSRNGADARTASGILLKMSSPTKLVDAPKLSSNKGIVE